MKKIVAIGPESTGKSTLCEQLAAYYHALWCPEYAREYVLKHGMDYTYDDLLIIAKGQLELEEKIEAEAKSRELEKQNESIHSPITNSQSPIPSSLLFIDTDMYVMKVWCEYVFRKCHQFIPDNIAKRKYDLYLLCNIDLPWIKDELREYPDEQTRKELYFIYKNLLINQQTPWVEISGAYEERLQKAIEAVGLYCMNP